MSIGPISVRPPTPNPRALATNPAQCVQGAKVTRLVIDAITILGLRCASDWHNYILRLFEFFWHSVERSFFELGRKTHSLLGRFRIGIT